MRRCSTEGICVEPEDGDIVCFDTADWLRRQVFVGRRRRPAVSFPKPQIRPSTNLSINETFGHDTAAPTPECLTEFHRLRHLFVRFVLFCFGATKPQRHQMTTEAMQAQLDEATQRLREYVRHSAPTCRDMWAYP